MMLFPNFVSSPICFLPFFLFSCFSASQFPSSVSLRTSYFLLLFRMYACFPVTWFPVLRSPILWKRPACLPHHWHPVAVGISLQQLCRRFPCSCCARLIRVTSVSAPFSLVELYLLTNKLLLGNMAYFFLSKKLNALCYLPQFTLWYTVFILLLVQHTVSPFCVAA